MTGSAVERARHLLAAGRNEDALVELGRALADDPEDAVAHGLRGLALLDLERLDEALESAERAVGADPEEPFGHEVRGWVLLRAGRRKDALASAEEALALDPDDVEVHDLVASANVTLRRWRAGLEAAERGLELDPEHARCLNLRALCLRQLGDKDEATTALGTALSNDPENAWTHQNLGMAHLAAGRHEEAIAAFKESLRLDPTDAASREGLATALKARYVLYRPIVAWQMLCGRLSERFGILLVVGFFLLHRVVQSALPEGSLFGKVLLTAYLSVVWMSWAGNAVFDLMLLAQPRLRGLLDARERVSALGVLVCLVLAAWGAVAALAFHGSVAETVALAGAFAAIPMSGWVRLPNGKARAVGIALAATAFGLVAAAASIDLWVTRDIGWDFLFDGVDAVPRADLEQWVARYDTASSLSLASLIVSVGSSWLLTALGFVPEARGGRGARRRPR
ncbi:MAG: tetratricopeptide repeat protein [Planctomycetota bacterium]